MGVVITVTNLLIMYSYSFIMFMLCVIVSEILHYIKFKTLYVQLHFS